MFAPPVFSVTLFSVVIVAISWVPLFIVLAKLRIFQSVVTRVANAIFLNSAFLSGWAIYVWVIVGPIRRFYERLFPRAIFAIGDGAQRYEQSKSWRTVVLVIIVLGALISLAMSVAGTYIVEWLKS
jgi:hypothetical protein